MRILLFGRGGQVGRELAACLPALAEVITCDRSEVDLSDAAAIRERVSRERPHLVLNAAAYTAVDAAEQHVEAAMAINARAPGAIAEAAASVGASLIHYSTDYVFDGEAARPYVETDGTKPLGVYGASKLAGEQAVYAARVPHLILRTSGVYSHAAGNFVTTIRRAAQTRPQLEVVTDQAGSPTWARTIAQTTRRIIEQWQGGRDPRQGIYNLVSRGDPSRHLLATRIVALARARGETKLEPSHVKPILTHDLPAQAARRPRYSALATAKIEHDFALTMPDWDRDLEAFFGAAPA